MIQPQQHDDQLRMALACLVAPPRQAAAWLGFVGEALATCAATLQQGECGHLLLFRHANGPHPCFCALFWMLSLRSAQRFHVYHGNTTTCISQTLLT
jgi:hypothetical protein